mgnify:CR=1 FL=1
MKYTILILEPSDYSEKALATYRQLGPMHFFSKLSPKERVIIQILAMLIYTATHHV